MDCIYAQASVQLFPKCTAKSLTDHVLHLIFLGIPRENLAELHGNMFVDECSVCKKMYVRDSASTTVGRKMSKESCKNRDRRPCRGKLKGTNIFVEIQC